MKRFSYILLAGLAASCLASCDKQDLTPSSEENVEDRYSIAIEEDFQTKATEYLTEGQIRQFTATLKKNNIAISCNDWEWKYSSAIFSQESKFTALENGVTVGKLVLKAKAKGSAIVSATTDSKNTGGNIVTSNEISFSVKVIESLTFTVAKTSLTAGGNTTYTLTANYSDGSTADVTSSTTVTSSNSTMLSASGGTIQSNKQIGCLGSFTLTASYGSHTASKDITVNTDYKSDDIKLSWNSDIGRSGEASSGSLNGYVKRGDASTVTVSFSGILKTSNSDTYAVSSDFIEFYVKDTGTPNYSKASTSQTYRAEEGDGEVYEIRYLGKSVKTWTINWYGY